MGLKITNFKGTTASFAVKQLIAVLKKGNVLLKTALHILK